MNEVEFDLVKELYPGQELRLERLTWTDVSDRLIAGWYTAVFSVGAIEQHGPHMPIATDALLGDTTAYGVAAELGNALVAPTIYPGFSPHHMDFPGTLTLRPATLIALIVDYCTSLAAHGFKNLVVISSHGGNTSLVKMGAQEAQEAVGNQVTVVPITDVVGYWKPDYDRKEEGYHATHLEASRVMAIAPGLVHMERARNWKNPIQPELRDVGALLGLRPVKFFAPDGTMGKPEGANPALGRESILYICRNIASQVQAMLRLI